jgi:hypothetical protein
MYFVTGFLLVHHELFDEKDPVVITSIHELSVPNNLTNEKLPVFIQDMFQIHGQRKKMSMNVDGSIEISYVRPGHNYKVIVSPGRSTVKILHTEQTLRQTLIIFHRLEKYGGGMVYNIYIFMMDLSGIALIIFSLTGIYMFFTTIKRKAIGWVILSVSIAYTLLVIFSFLQT